MDEAKSYRVWMRSKPGFWERYDGYVDVYAQNEDAAVLAARRKLGGPGGTFSDRGFDAWIIEKVERTWR